MGKIKLNLSSEKKLKDDVSLILRRVRFSGDDAVSFFTRKYDGVSLSARQFMVEKNLILKASKRLSPDVKKSIAASAARIKFFAKKQMNILPRSSWQIKNPDGVSVGEIVLPLTTAAIYVPGGRYPYPSTVLMSAIPAKVAGVKRIYILTPPKGVCDEVLYAAYVSGVTEIYRIGGVQAIAAAAYGTRTIPKADIIVGPGNKYVAEAKRQVFGEVGIDMLAGPSEVAIIADGKAPVEWVVSDISAQAEHDPDAVCWLLSVSDILIRKVKEMLHNKYLSQLRIRKVGNIIDACKIVSDEIAPEHLELMVTNAKKYINKIRNAGAIFVGYYTPTALGDYCAGPSHVLPTQRAARFSSGLSVGTFLKRTSVIISDKKNTNWIPIASTLAEREGLTNHRLASQLRSLKK